LVRFAITPSPPQGQSAEPLAPQLALSRVHPCLVPLERVPGGCAPQADATRGWFELPLKRGLAGYGLSRALRILLDALSGLTALEDTKTVSGQPFVHGELVPAMIRVDLTGVARLIALAPRHWSAPGTLAAPERCAHLAPERLLGDAIDARADVFSAGVLLWEALAGGRLFENDSVDSIVMRLMGEKITLPQLPPELSWAAPLKAVAMCALSVDPQQRFANCAQLAQAIEDVARDRLATHAEVAKFFGSPEPNAHLSVIARAASAQAHNSSLSGLIAPARSSSASISNQSETTERDPSVPASQMKRRVWAAAAISCLVTAIGVSAIASYHSGHETRHQAAQGAAALAERIPAASSVAPAPAPLATTEPAANPTEPPEPRNLNPNKPAKSKPDLKLGKPSKGLVAKPRQSTKAARTPDRAAAKYGI